MPRSFSLVEMGAASDVERSRIDDAGCDARNMVVLALVLAVASAGTVLCEMDCAAGDTGASATGMHDGSMNVAISHCDGERIDSAQHEGPPTTEAPAETRNVAARIRI